MKFFAYEGGEQILVSGGSSPNLTLLCAWDSYAKATTFTHDMLQTFRNIVGSGGLFNYYTDAGNCSYPSSWGLVYYPQQSTSAAAKYQGALQQLQFLLKRDIDPASNNNTPMFLDKAA
jgi:hypothetical protein